MSMRKSLAVVALAAPLALVLERQGDALQLSVTPQPGAKLPSTVAGYVAGFPIPEVLQGINAFTLGMRSVNPKAQVKVVWLNAWFDPGKERDAATFGAVL